MGRDSDRPLSEEPVPGDAVASGERKRQVSASSSAIVEPWASTARTDVAARLQYSMRFTRRAIGSVSPLDGRSDAVL